MHVAMTEEREEKGLGRSDDDALCAASTSLTELIETAYGLREDSGWGRIAKLIENDAMTLMENASASGDAKNVDVVMQMSDFVGKFRAMFSAAEGLRGKIRDTRERRAAEAAEHETGGGRRKR